MREETSGSSASSVRRRCSGRSAGLRIRRLSGCTRRLLRFSGTPSRRWGSSVWMAQEYGDHEKDGRWVLAVDSFSPSEFMERYDVSAVKDEDTGKYIVTVEERNAEN